MDSVHSSKQTRFISWLTENKAVFPKLDFCEDGDGCGSVYCSEDIASDEVFASIPFSPLVLTDALARKQLPSSVESLDGRTVLLLFVIQQRLLNEQSFFHPYLDMIPERIHNALEFDDQDLEHLKGTNAFLTVKELKAKLACKYEEVLQVVGEDLKPEDGYTWERYLWAETVIASRAFPAVLFGGGIEGEIVLIPLADSLNHKSRHKVTWIKTPQGLEISSSSIAQGQQVFNNYGPKSNEELLIGYGFCTEGNMDDLVTIKTNFSRDPDQERKSDILKYVGVTEQTIHYLRHDGIPDLLLVTMRVMAMNSAEVDHCLSLMEKVERKQEDDTCGTMKQSITAVLTQELQFAGLRNEFSMLNLMDMLIHAKLQGITEWDQRLKEPQNQAQEFAQVYRQGQKQILESCSDICRGMFSVLLEESCSPGLSTECTVFLETAATTTGTTTISEHQRRACSSESYTPEFFQSKATEESRTMSELKQDAVRQIMLTAKGIMVEHKDGLFGEAFSSAFPGHGWGEEDEGQEDYDPEDEEEEMAVQMENDAILTCFLIYARQNPGQFSSFITAAEKHDYSSQLDEDMKEDVESLRESLQEALEDVDEEIFDFNFKFTSEAFIWATGLLETLSLTLHIDGKAFNGVLAPRCTTSSTYDDADVMGGGRAKRKHE